MAAWEMARSLLVVLPIADTTTIGLRSARAFTMAATRSMAAADSTELPPNFITIMTAPLPDGRGSERDSSVQHAFRVHQFRVENRRARRAANRVVTHCHEL